MLTRYRLVFAALVSLLALGPVLHPVTILDPSTVLTSPSDPAPPAALPDGLLSPGIFLLGAIRVKDIGTIAKKFVRNAGAAAGDYKTGVEAAGADWEAGARAGAENYGAGVQQAIADKRFEKGIAAAGSAKFVSRAGTLGAQRFPTGIQASEGEFTKGAAPYLEALRGIDLPPRRPKGDPGNMARANAVATKLRMVKLGR